MWCATRPTGEVAAFGVDEGSGERQAERVGSRIGAACALIANADAYSGSHVFDGDGDVAGAVSERVVEEHVEGLTNRGVAARDRGIAGRVDGDLAVRLAHCRLEESDVVVGQCAEVNWTGAGVVAVTAGDLEELRDRFEEPVGVSDRRSCFLSRRVERIGRGDLFEPDRERGERRAQLMRGVEGEASLGGYELRDPLGRTVECIGDGVEFSNA